MAADDIDTYVFIYFVTVGFRSLMASMEFQNTSMEIKFADEVIVMLLLLYYRLLMITAQANITTGGIFPIETPGRKQVSKYGIRSLQAVSTLCH